MGELHDGEHAPVNGRPGIQFIGMIRTDNISEIDSAVALSVEATIDPDFVRDFAHAHEAAGFDRVLIGYHSTGPDAWLVAAHAAANTERLHMLVAHRPGFQAPTVAARAAVTLDHFSRGRVSLNIVTGGSDSERARLRGSPRRSASPCDPSSARRKPKRGTRRTATWSGSSPIAGTGRVPRPRPAHSGCSISRRNARSSTTGSGWQSPRPLGRAAIPPPWSAHRSRSPNR